MERRNHLRNTMNIKRSCSNLAVFTSGFPPQFFLSRGLVYFYDVLLLLNVYHCYCYLLLLFICVLSSFYYYYYLIDVEVVSLC